MLFKAIQKLFKAIQSYSKLFKAIQSYSKAIRDPLVTYLRSNHPDLKLRFPNFASGARSPFRFAQEDDFR